MDSPYLAKELMQGLLLFAVLAIVYVVDQLTQINGKLYGFPSAVVAASAKR